PKKGSISRSTKSSASIPSPAKPTMGASRAWTTRAPTPSTTPSPRSTAPRTTTRSSTSASTCPTELTALAPSSGGGDEGAVQIAHEAVADRERDERAEAERRDGDERRRGLVAGEDRPERGDGAHALPEPGAD